jgi:hypothetical protein
MKMLFPRAAAVAASVVVLASSCTSSSQPRPTASITPDGSPRPRVSSHSRPGAEAISPTAAERCTFGSMRQVSRSFGAKVRSEKVGPTGIGRRQCTFTVTSSDVGAPGTVTLTLGTKVARSVFDRARTAAAGTPVEGVGDRAFYTARTQSLSLLKGATMVVIAADLRVPGSARPKPQIVRRDLIRLGRSVAANL